MVNRVEKPKKTISADYDEGLSMSEADRLFARAHRQWDSERVLSAFRLFLEGAKGGDPGAQHCLGYFYDVGVAVKPNQRAALYWYKRAFRHGYRIAAANIGTIFRDKNDWKQALSWFQRAVRLGDGDANLEIAKIYAHHCNDFGRAVTHLKRAIRAKPTDITQGGREDARLLLAQLAPKPSSRAGRK